MDSYLIILLLTFWACVLLSVWNYVDIRPYVIEWTARRRLRELSRVSGGGKRANSTMYRPKVLVFSDIDDTLKPSGGKMFGAFAGVDLSYVKTARHPFYPGMAQFLYELSKLSNPTLPVPEWVPRVNFISGRPWGRFSQLQLELLKMVDGWGVYAADHIVLNGRKRDTYRHIGDWSTSKIFTEYGETKFRNLSNLFKSRDDDYRFFAIGDNGQGDVAMASRICQDEELALRVLGIFIHEVIPRERDRHRKHVTDPRVIFYTNVIDLVAKINENKAVRATFDVKAQRAIHCAFVAEFANYQSNLCTNVNSVQVQVDYRDFERLRYSK